MELTSSNPAHVRKWLASHHPKQLTLLSQFEMELRLGRLSTSSTFSARNISSAQSIDPNNSLAYPATKYQDGCSSNIGGQDRRLVTKRTVELLRTLIGATKWKTAAQLLFLCKGLGRELYSAGGFREPAIGNVVRRVMCAIRDEALALSTIQTQTQTQAQAPTQNLGEMMESKLSLADKHTNSSSTSLNRSSSLSLSTMLWAHTQHVKPTSTALASKAVERERLRERFGRNRRSDSVTSVTSTTSKSSSHSHTPNEKSALTNVHEEEKYNHHEYDYDDDDDVEFPPVFYIPKYELKERVMEAIQETVSELDDLHKNINDQALNHIHAGEIILCYGRSKTIELFLKAAASKSRSFHVIIAEGAPHFSGHAMAKSLATSSPTPIPTTVIHDAATFAIMARVNKVLLPAHAVLANGGLVAPSGCHMVALAARENSVPVVAITGMFKLCPQFPHEGQDTLNDLVSPSSVMEYGEGTSMILSALNQVDDDGSNYHDYEDEDDSDDDDDGAEDTVTGNDGDGTSVGNVMTGIDDEPNESQTHDMDTTTNTTTAAKAPPSTPLPSSRPPSYSSILNPSPMNQHSNTTTSETKDHEYDDYDEVELINPVHDYIPPDLIKLYVTNIGGFQPSYIYKLLAEYYHPDDWESFE